MRVPDKFLKCPYCRCIFISRVDLEAHLSSRHWRRGRNGWEWMPADEARDLAARLRASGDFADGAYIYSMSGDGRAVFRKKASPEI
jgi:hypothetical protein